MIRPAQHVLLGQGRAGEPEPPGPDPVPVTDGLFLQYDAQQEGLADGDPMPVLNDYSGNDRHAISGSTTEFTEVDPVFLLDGVNGHPAVRYETNSNSDTKKFHILQDFLAEMDGSGGEIFMVLACQNDPGGSVYTSGSFTFGNTAANTIHWPYTDGRLFMDWGTSTRRTVGDSDNFGNTLTSPHIVNARSFPSDWSCQVIQSGTQLIDMASASNTPEFNLNSYIGASYFGTTEYAWNGFLGEMLIYSRDLSTQERTDVLAYLETKWDLDA